MVAKEKYTVEQKPKVVPEAAIVVAFLDNTKTDLNSYLVFVKMFITGG